MDTDRERERERGRERERERERKREREREREKEKNTIAQGNKTSQYRVNKILVGNVTINSDIKYKEATRKRGRKQKRIVPVSRSRT
jgi:hypothetical protein